MPSENGALHAERSGAQNTHTTGHLRTLVATIPSDAQSDGRNPTRCVIPTGVRASRAALSRCALWDTVRLGAVARTSAGRALAS
jgi:hypothetical protein